MSLKQNNRARLAIQSILQMLEKEGIEPELCLRQTGFTSEQLLNQGTDLPDRLEIKILDQALALLPQRAGYGIEAGQALQVDNFGVWGLAILTSPDLRSAFEIVSRFSNMSIMLSRVLLQEDDDTVSLVLDMQHLPITIHRYLFERYCALTINFLRDMLPDFDFSSAELWLPFDDADYQQALSKLTQLTVKTERPYFAISLASNLFDISFAKTDALIHAHFISECEQLLDNHQTLPDYAQRIRNYVLHNKAFNPKLSDVAKSLFISDRTLRRRLQEEDHSFSEVVLDTKMTLAKEWLMTAKLPVKVVAAQLDYSEPASFIRAFSKWFGVPPTEIQAHHVPLRYA